MTTTDLLKKVRRIEIKSKGLSQQMFAGQYHSAFKGRGMSFSEVRNYQYGDDVRNIDWNVTARTGETHVKVFEEERELTLMLMVDISRSAFFGTRGQLRSELLTEICATLAFSAGQNNDKVGLLLFSDRVELYIPPKKGRSHLLRIIRELLETKPKGKGTDIGKALDFFLEILKKRSICFLLSDFLGKGYEKTLGIATRRHDIVGLHVYDPSEKELPKLGLIRAEDAETGREQWLDTGSKQVRERYQQQIADNWAYAESAFRIAQADLLSMASTEDYVRELRRFFESRRK
ncbi:MAG: DUF58 domain-containing protein [Bacteroidota bacterium]